MNGYLTLEEGSFLVRFARQVVERYIQDQSIIEPPHTESKALQENRGVFVTIKKQDTKAKEHLILRGCIGRLQPSPGAKRDPTPLLEATRQAALSSAVEDPRFPPMQITELDSILIEVSVLTMPEEIIVEDRANLPENIIVGKDGLIIDGGAWRKGLLLPQVAPEQGWNAVEFLEGCCQKSGLPPKSYLDPKVKIFKFQAQIFAETSKGGEVIERRF